MQKVHLETGGLCTAGVLFLGVPFAGSRAMTVLVGGGGGEGLFAHWNWRVCCVLAVQVAQGWMAGLVAKHLSTVAKSVVQCLSLIVIVFGGDLLLFGREVGSLDIFLLAPILAFSALVFQTGRCTQFEYRSSQPQQTA